MNMDVFPSNFAVERFKIKVAGRTLAPVMTNAILSSFLTSLINCDPNLNCRTFVFGFARFDVVGMADKIISFLMPAYLLNCGNHLGIQFPLKSNFGIVSL